MVTVLRAGHTPRERPPVHPASSEGHRRTGSMRPSCRPGVERPDLLRCLPRPYSPNRRRTWSSTACTQLPRRAYYRSERLDVVDVGNHAAVVALLGVGASLAVGRQRAIGGFRRRSSGSETLEDLGQRTSCRHPDPRNATTSVMMPTMPAPLPMAISRRRASRAGRQSAKCRLRIIININHRSHLASRLPAVARPRCLSPETPGKQR